MGRMPPCVIKHKESLRLMSDEDFAKKYANHDDAKLKSMAWSNGYGKNSLEYVNKKIRGQNIITLLIRDIS